jgi:hypothetical protein
MDNMFWPLATVVIGALSIIIPFAVYLVQQRSRRDQLFRDCASSLRSENQIEQSTAAILLRGFIKRRCYSNKAKDVMTELLRNPSVSVGLL